MTDALEPVPNPGPSKRKRALVPQTSAHFINLATQPFRRERAQNLLLGLASAVLMCSLVVLVASVLQERGRAAHLRQSIDLENATLQRAVSDQNRYSAILSKPENSDVFAVSVFLNELVARRAVSWTRVFKDLGTVLPRNVRLIGLRLPQVPSEDTSGVNHLQLDMLLGTDKPEQIVDVLKLLQTSHTFGAAQMLAQQPPSQTDPLYKFRVTVAYDQKL